MSAAVVQRLREHATLGEAPIDELEWLAAHGHYRRMAKGDTVARPGETIDHLYVMLSGAIAHHLERSYGVRKIIEWHGGDVTGLLPYSRLSTADGTTAATVDTEVLMLPRDRVRELPTACPEVTAILVHAMLDRARHFTSADLNDRKALALGKVAAGLAHELNNPASALVRSAKTLADTLGAGGAGGSSLAPADDPSALAAARKLYAICKERPPADWDAITRADREEALEDWLMDAGEDPDLAAVLADSPLELDEVFGLAEETDRPAAAAAAVCRMARGMYAEQLAEEIGEGAARIFHLVNAVKRFTHMDQTMALADVDVNASLTDAVTLVSEKARAANVDLDLDLPGDAPQVTGVVEELNQMWHALIDNAIDAAAPDGAVRVACSNGSGEVLVEIQDDGPGIPDGIRDRVFDPFFTTKPVGAGAGLGLEVVRRVVDQHRGAVEFTSAPGTTVFRVSLPTEGPG